MAFYMSVATCEVYFRHLWNLRKSARICVKLSNVHLLMRVDLTLIPLPFWDSTLRVPPASAVGCLLPADISPCHPAGRSDHQRSLGAAAPRALLEKGLLPLTNLKKTHGIIPKIVSQINISWVQLVIYLGQNKTFKDK